jgi:non-heme chloroperoxidase
MTTLIEREQQEIDKANGTGRRPVVFIHGLWQLPSCWDAWEATFEQAGFTATAPGWPDDPATVEEARARPEIFAGKQIKQIKQIADHHAEVATRLARKPVVIGYSFGGLLTQMIAARGLAAASVAISPAPLRGVLPVPISSLKALSPVLRNPANRHRAVPLTTSNSATHSGTRSATPRRDGFARRTPCPDPAR